jgi:two-component system response regulator
MNREQPILLVEDNDDDAELTEMAFREAKVSNPLLRIKDGVEALDYLLCRGPHAGRDANDAPAVVLLDLKLPRLSGLEVLTALRANERTKQLPVVVLTSSTEDMDRLTAYAQHANSYVQKPVDYDHFVTAARQLGLYWTLLNVPPPGGRK